MKLGLKHHFNTLRRVIVLTLLVALCTPSFATLLPTPALSAEQQLIVDLGQNICSHSRSESGDQNKPDSGHECCVLCAASHQILLVQNSGATPDPLQLVSYRIEPFYPAANRPRGPPDLRATGPRAPPTV
jgi:Protein of unknown function (DUF2946)